MMKQLIIKCGASGDVVRTTPLLRVPGFETWWVTAPLNEELLPGDSPGLTRILPLGEARAALRGESFDRVISLDDELEPASLVDVVRSSEIVGARLEDGKVAYTPSAEPWFGMGLLSKDGLQKANERKYENSRTYQEILFDMLGLRFAGEEYRIPHPDACLRDPKSVAIEARAGDRWPTKQWNQYDALAARLEGEGFEVNFLRHRPTIADYMKDIGACGHLVCGDTLAMHLGLALGLNVTAIFTCTAPQEIYGYGRLEKVVSPRLSEAYYRKNYNPEAVEAVTLDEVFGAFTRQANRTPA